MGCYLGIHIFFVSLWIHVPWPCDLVLSGGINGYIYISDKPVCPLEINPPIGDTAMIMKNEVLSVFYKYPSFHSYIPKPPGVIVPEKAVKKRDVLPSPLLWHEKSSFLGRIVPKRPSIPESVSGQSLAKLAHQLVCKYYLAKKPVSHRCMKVGNHGGVDFPTCQSNLKATVCGKEQDGGSENYILLLNLEKENGTEVVIEVINSATK
ncbi:5'-3' exoribonuclease 4 [Camellia lanceoleosa]|uniref:5'-3' exoribonuclease 4 n=1 Tax=Camellia lanceoleosa TaxID=1840588 RepID=A0ACC0FHN2_9ERIC|nr:5'-3' exoribonuclease 4 [Camellia lanceoleosa]